MWKSFIENPRTSIGAVLIAAAVILVAAKVIDPAGFTMIAGVAGAWAFANCKDGDR